MFSENYVRINVVFHNSGQKTAFQVISKINFIIFHQGNRCTIMTKNRTVLLSKEYFRFALKNKFDFQVNSKNI